MPDPTDFIDVESDASNTSNVPQHNATPPAPQPVRPVTRSQKGYVAMKPERYRDGT
jgi:hypothetical protein